MAKAPVRVAVTGAAGQIGYSLLFRIASGEMLGKDQPVILQLLDLPQAQKAVKGVMMELEDCAFPLLAGMIATDDPNVAFKDAQVCLLVGARPRGWNAGMDIDSAVQRLPDGARTVFVLHDVEGYRHDEIGVLLGVSVGTSKSQLHRARMALRGHLTAEATS